MLKFLPNIGYYKMTLPPFVKDAIMREAKEIESDFSKHPSFSERLAGHLKHEYALEKCFPMVEAFMVATAKQYEEDSWLAGAIDPERKRGNYRLQSLWVNFQQKGEFNPPHKHSGELSFVTWLQIPYDLEEELKLYQANRARNSFFEFIYPSILGDTTIEPFKLSKANEGELILFPSMLYHTVHPFYSADGFRISVSGNLHLDT